MSNLKVWWIPQIPMKAFEVEVKSIDEAKLILNTLADYDKFQYDNRVKGDYANAGGLLVLEEGEWGEWYDSEGDDINDIMRREVRREEAHKQLGEEAHELLR